MRIHKSKKDILNGNISEQILMLTFGLLWTYLLQELYGSVDSILVGRYVGPTALAAIGGSGTMIINVLINLITGIASGVMIVVAQNYGRGDYPKVYKSVKTGMFIAVVMGLLITVLSCVLAKPLLHLMNCPEEIIPDSLIYMIMYFVSFVPYMIYTIGNFIFRATGDSKRPFLFTVITAIVRISLDVLLTAVLKLGMWGVAISTFTSHLICGIFVLIIFNYTSDCYQFSMKDFGYDLDCLKQIFKIGIPVALQNILFSITNLLMQVKINNFGTNSIAAFSAFNTVDNLYWSFCNSIGAAVLTIAGQNYGNKNMDRVHKTIKSGLLIHLFAAICFGCLNYFFGENLLQLFTTDSEVIMIGKNMLKICAMFYCTYIFIEIISGSIKGCGDSTNSMIISFIGICVIRIIYLYTAKLDSAIEVVYAFPISWIITSIIFIVYYKLSKKYKLTKNN